MEGSGSSLSAEKASGIESISSSTPESTSLKSTYVIELSSTCWIWLFSARLSVNLAANLNQARNVYRQFRFTFRRRSRRDFYLNLYDRYDDSVEEREHINTLVTGLTKLLKLMKIFASEVKNYAGRDKSQIVEVDGYIRTMESWVEAMNAFDYWASWGKETLTAELHGREGNIHHLISDIWVFSSIRAQFAMSTIWY